MSPSEQALRAHLAEALWISGEVDDRWHLFAFAWPYATFTLPARGGECFRLRLEFSGYPVAEPTGTFWDVERDQMLDHRFWPRGQRASTAFRPDWENGSALYLPCDRVTVRKHEPRWPYQTPELRWRSEVGLTHYLEIVYAFLQDPDVSYSPSAREPAAVE